MDMKERLSSGTLDWSRSGEVIEADSLVTEELLLSTDPEPISKPALGDLPKRGRDDDRLLIGPPRISLPSTTWHDPWGYRAWYMVTISAGHNTIKGWTSVVSRGEVTALDGRSTGVESAGRGQ